MAIRAAGTYVTKKKSSKKGKSRQKENRFSKKKFFNLTTQAPFPVTLHGQTCQTRIRSKLGLKNFLVGRTFSVNQGDLVGDNKETHRNFCFKVGDVKGHDCVGFFNGMYLARDKMAGMVRKWHTLVEANLDLTTKDGSTWRFFVSAVTRRKMGHTGKTCYAKTSQVKEIRKIMFEVLKAEADGMDTDKLVKKLSTETIGKEIEARCADIFNIMAVVRKVKPIKNMKIVEVAGSAIADAAEDAGNTFDDAIVEGEMIQVD